LWQNVVDTTSNHKKINSSLYSLNILSGVTSERCPSPRLCAKALTTCTIWPEPATTLLVIRPSPVKTKVKISSPVKKLNFNLEKKFFRVKIKNESFLVVQILASHTYNHHLNTKLLTTITAHQHVFREKISATPTEFSGSARGWWSSLHHA